MRITSCFSTVFRIGMLLLVLSISLEVSAEAEIEQKNAVNLFVGNTQNGSLSGASIGLGYERRLTSLIGVGGFLEHAAGDFDTTSVGATLSLHPHAGWAFKLSPGVEFDGSERNLMFRIGVGYEFEVVPSWAIVPEFNVDFVDGERELVYGVSAQYEF
jgi:hypothetical protein